MLHNNPTGQSRIVHPALPLGRREQQSGPGNAQADLSGRMLLPPGEHSGLHSPLLEKIAAPPALNKERNISQLAWWILRIQICCPSDLRITERRVNSFSPVWPVCPSKAPPSPPVAGHVAGATCAFSGNSWARQKLAGALQLGWSLAQQRELLMARLKPLI